MSSLPDCIFLIHQLWQSGFSRVYSNCCCSCSFEAEIIEIGQSCHKMYSNNILNFQESTTILNACTKKVWKLIEYTTFIWLNSFFVGFIHLHVELFLKFSLRSFSVMNACDFAKWFIWLWRLGWPTISLASKIYILYLWYWTFFIYRYSKVHFQYIYHVALLAQISLILSRHLSLSSITPRRSSRLHPVSAQSCCI